MVTSDSSSVSFSGGSFARVMTSGTRPVNWYGGSSAGLETQGDTLNVMGGTLASLAAEMSGTANWSGGSAGMLLSHNSGTINVYGTGLKFSDIVTNPNFSQGLLSGQLADGTVLNDVPYIVSPSSTINLIDVVPEPSTLVGAAVGVLMLLAYSWRRRRQRNIR